jgi:hypothetical protein
MKKNIKLATTLTVNSDFKGALAGELLVEAMKKADTIGKGLITVLPNVIGSGYLPKLTYSDSLAAYSCGFTATGTVDYTEKEVATKKFKIEHELCKDTFHQTFAAQAAGLFGANNDIPATVQEGILLAIIDRLGETIDSQIWNGNNSTSQFNGYHLQFSGDAAVIDVSATTVTASNVVAEITRVYDAIPEAIINEPDLVIVVSPNVARAYKQALAAQGLNTFNFDKELDFLGVRMESVAGLASNRMVAYRIKNLAFLTGLESDYNSVAVKDMDESTLDGTIRTKVTFSAGVGYSFGGEIVYYSNL